MASVGIEVIETDLGERIQQLDNEDPSHVVVPAVHKLRTDVAEVFAKTIGTDPANSDVHYLAEAQREATRPLILAADAGMTGCNSRSPRPVLLSSAPTKATPTFRRCA
jgi:L-lactate dehydrogenase complex protein LldF